MRHLVLCLLGIAAVSSAQMLDPSADYFYPTGADAPVNAKILVHSARCGEIHSDAISLRAGAQTVSGRSDIATASLGSWIVFTHAQPLLPRTTCTVTMSKIGHASTAATFTTGTARDSTPPVV